MVTALLPVLIEVYTRTRNTDVDITQAMRGSEIAEYKNKQAAISLREAAFQGRTNIELGEKNNFIDGEGTVYTRRNDTLGATEFGVFENERWDDDAYEDEEDFKAPVWDEERLNLVRINMGHLYQQEEDDDNNENGEESKTNENKEEDDDTGMNNETTLNQVREGDGNKTDDPGREEEIGKSREVQEELQYNRGGGEEEEIAPGTTVPAPSKIKPTIPTLSNLNAMMLYKENDRLFFISTLTGTNNVREWRLVRLNYYESLIDSPSCMKTGNFLCKFYRCHPADEQLNAINQRFWLQYFKTADLLHPKRTADNHLVRTSNTSKAYATEHDLKIARNYIEILHDDTFIHGPFNFATAHNRKTSDRIGQEDWQALANHRHMFQNSISGLDDPTYSLRVDNEFHISCPGIHQDVFDHMFALPDSDDDDDSLFSSVGDTVTDDDKSQVGKVVDADTDSPKTDNAKEYISRVSGTEAEIKNNISTHTQGGGVEGEEMRGVEQNQNQDDWHVKGARKYKPTEEERTEPTQSKKMRSDEGYGEMDWNARKQRFQETKQRYHDRRNNTRTSENSTTEKYPGNQHNEEAGNLGEGTDEGYGEMDWNARKQRFQETKQRYHDMRKTTMTSENSTTEKYPRNQHKEEAGNLGEETE